MRKYSLEEVRDGVLAAVARQGFNRWLAPELVAADENGVEVLLKIRPDMTQHHGYVHGGCVSALANSACAWAGAMTSGHDVVTSSYSIHLVAPATGSHLRARATTLRAGRSVATVEVQIFSEAEGSEPKLCAAGIASIAILPARAGAAG